MVRRSAEDQDWGDHTVELWDDAAGEPARDHPLVRFRTGDLVATTGEIHLPPPHHVLGEAAASELRAVVRRWLWVKLVETPAVTSRGK